MKEFKPRKFKARINEFGLDDFGYSGKTFEVQSLTKGKIYYERDPSTISTRESGVVIDDNGCWWHVGSDSFNERFKEVTAAPRDAGNENKRKPSGKIGKARLRDHLIAFARHAELEWNCPEIPEEFVDEYLEGISKES